MSFFRHTVVPAFAFVGAVLVVMLTIGKGAGLVVPAPDACKTAAISKRAAQICSTELVGCSLTFEQVKQVIAEQEAAKGCE